MPNAIIGMIVATAILLHGCTKEARHTTDYANNDVMLSGIQSDNINFTVDWIQVPTSGNGETSVSVVIENIDSSSIEISRFEVLGVILSAKVVERSGRRFPLFHCSGSIDIDPAESDVDRLVVPVKSRWRENINMADWCVVDHTLIRRQSVRIELDSALECKRAICGKKRR